MKRIKIETSFEVYDSIKELATPVQNLILKATEARKKAYAPYSKFLVGAALELENGQLIAGNNQENASYPSGLCAERTAIYYAGAEFPNQKIIRMAIVAGSTTNPTPKPIPPCGACRQALSEYEVKQNMPMELYFMGTSGQIAYSNSVENILPWIFDKTVL
ncbi:MAG: cytidine deaminase [Flavobacteriaceae bacterium]|jgi:cytidine deaminase|nr:cytidine deaminase [Flavobacteriaceae bacterium]